MNERVQEKQAWERPELKTFGTVEDITKGGTIPPKVFGIGDGAVWNNMPVQWEIS